MLAEALASIERQTFDDWECIIVQDGEDRATAFTALDFVSRDARFNHRVVDRGGSPARTRNAGLAGARAPLVAFLDDDDRFRPDKLARQVTLLEGEPSVELCCGRVSEFGAREGIWPAIPLGPELELAALIRGNEVATSTVMARRRSIEAVGGFDERWRLAEDYSLWLRLATRRPLRFMDCVLADYRIHEGGASRSEPAMLEAIEGVLESLMTDGLLPSAPVRKRIRALYRRRSALSDAWREKAYWRWRTLTAWLADGLSARLPPR
jgi:glycosyltransferase involved in cell wall biosynthesis